MKNARSDKRMKNTSKFISLILRHRPAAIGISSDVETAKKVGSRHGIPKGKELSQEEQNYIVDVLMKWIERYFTDKQ